MATTVSNGLHLYVWSGTDSVLRTEFNFNFSALENAVLQLASATQDGRMSIADFSKLAGIETGAQKNVFTFANIKMGAVTAAADSVQDTFELVAGTGITITGDATNDKGTFALDKTYTDGLYAPKTHTHAIADITSLQTTLDGKSATGHTHTIANVTGLQTALDGKSATGHTHTIGEVTGLQTSLDGKAASVHTHAIGDVTGLQNALDGKSATGHGHNASAITVVDAANKLAATNVEDALLELFTFASDVKTQVASATTDMGVPATSADTGAQLAAKIRQIYQGKKIANGNGSYSNTAGTSTFRITVTGVAFAPKRVEVRAKHENGMLTGPRTIARYGFVELYGTASTLEYQTDNNYSYGGFSNFTLTSNGFYFDFTITQGGQSGSSTITPNSFTYTWVALD